MNTIVNPYDRFAWQRIPGVNVLKPAVKNHAALTKAYQVERARPVTAIIGTSRAYLGMDSGSEQFPASFDPVYNYGLPGTTMGRSLLRELSQAWGTGRLRHVVAILDFPAFFGPDPPGEDGAEQRRLMFLDSGAPNKNRQRQRLDDAFLSIFSLAAFTDSVTTILSQRGDRIMDIRADGTSTDADFATAARAEGMNAVFAQKNEAALSQVPPQKHILANWHGTMPNLEIVRDMIGFCRERGVTLTLILGPSHIDGMETYRRAGLWQFVERLKVELAALVTEANSDTVEAWDFVEYTPYTTETVPPPGDKTTPTRWFWEQVHFKKALGDLMLRRVFSGAPDDFGARLTADTVAARNDLVREQQRAFAGWRLACELKTQNRCRVPDDTSAEASR
jgi:hypothetical protein